MQAVPEFDRLADPAAELSVIRTSQDSVDGQVIWGSAHAASISDQLRFPVFGAYGTVVTVPLDDLPGWLPAWCRDHLGGEPVGLPCVLGYADFEAQNLRWHGREVWAVHDWDSLAWQPEAALAGAASGFFGRAAGPSTLAPIESSEAFLVAYQDVRGRLFTAVEQEIAWAASLWPAAHNARWEALHGDTPVYDDALRAQGAERLRRANA